MQRVRTRTLAVVRPVSWHTAGLFDLNALQNPSSELTLSMPSVVRNTLRRPTMRTAAPPPPSEGSAAAALGGGGGRQYWRENGKLHGSCRPTSEGMTLSRYQSSTLYSTMSSSSMRYTLAALWCMGGDAGLSELEGPSRQPLAAPLTQGCWRPQPNQPPGSDKHSAALLVPRAPHARMQAKRHHHTTQQNRS
jgi:hypothetical protein